MLNPLLRDRFVLGSLALVAASLVAYATPWFTPHAAWWWAGGLAEPAFLLIVIACYLATPYSPEHREGRWFWRALLATYSIWLVGSLVNLVEPDWTWAQPFFLLSYLTFGLAADLRPHLPNRWTRGGSGFGFMVGATVLVVLALMLYFFAVPQIHRRANGLLSTRTAFIALDVLFALRFLHLAWRAGGTRWRPTYAWLAAASLASGATCVLGLAIDAGRFRIGFGTPLDALWWIPFVAGIAARRSFLFAEPRIPRRSPASDDEPRASAGELLLLYAFALPVSHVVLDAAGFLVPAEVPLRATILIGALIGLFGLSVACHRSLERSNRRLRSDLRVLVTNEQMIESQKMEAVGRLAGGVAHDFNNLLMVIGARAAILRERFPAGGPGRGDADEIRQAVDRGADLTRQLLLFKRGQPQRRKRLDLGIVVRDAEGLLRRLAGESIRLRTRGGPGLLPVEADPTQMFQVLINLVANARDAMPDGGDLEIETRQVRVTEPDASTIPPCQPGDYAVLEVRDTGTGVDPETMNRIFEPFFTRKVGGTGLGLAVVYAIVTGSSGHLRVRSELGRGSSFAVLLPSGPTPDGVEPAASPVAEPRSAGPAFSVLVVDDQESIRGAIVSMLETLGHQAIAVGTAEEARQVARALGSTLRVLITDIVMPGNSGMSVAAMVRAEVPEVRIVYMSGYAEESSIAEIDADPESEFLAKPFTLETLQDCLERTTAGV